MAKKSLKSFNLDELKTIMQNFASNSRIFNSEAQFQFELAWRINELFDCKVLLELLSRIEVVPNTHKNAKATNVIKKDYTDIVLEKDDLRIALELKYKTALLEKLSLSHHGAVDLGSYDFMWDVNRLQMLTGKTADETVKTPCERGYAVILTNDYHYWTTPINNNVINREFRIHGNGNGIGKLTKGQHEWYDTTGKPGLSKVIQKDKARSQSIALRKDYHYQWIPYLSVPNVEKNGEFKYMIVEVD